MKTNWLNIAARRPVGAIAIAALMAMAAAFCVTRLHLDTSIESFFSPGQKSVVALNRVLNDFPTAEELLILATTRGEQADPDELLAFAGKLEKAITADTRWTFLVSGVRYRASPQMRQFIADVVVPNAVDYLDDQQFAQAMHRLTPEGMRQQLDRDAAILAAPGPAAGALAKATLQDPLRLHEFVETRLAAARPMTTWNNSDAFLSSDGRSLLIRVAGVKPPSDLAFCQEITRVISKIANDVNADKLELKFSGAYPIAARSQQAIRSDCISSVNGSVICLALLFVLAFRRGIALFLVTFLPVALGILYGFGVYAMMKREVTPLTAVVGAVLGGIGIDYAIFYVVHYQQQRATGMATTQAAGTTITHILGALFAAWVTSVVGFIAVGFTSVRALGDFSLVGSLGLAGALLGAIFLLPALLVLKDRWSPARALPAAPRISLAPLIDWIDRHTGACVLVGSVLLVALGGWLLIAAPRLELETDMAVMHPQPNLPLQAEEDIARTMHIAADQCLVYLSSASPQRLLLLAHRVENLLSTPAARRIGVQSSFGLATLLPEVSEALERQEHLYDSRISAYHVVADFDAAVAHSPFDPQALAPYRTFLQKLLTPAAVPGLPELFKYPEVAQLVLPKQPLAGGVVAEAITYVSLAPPEGGGEESASQKLAQVQALRDLLADLPGVTVTGMAVLAQDTRLTIEHDLPRLIIAAVVLCAAYLLLHFRSLAHTLLAVLPSVCSLLCLLAVAKWAGAKMNLANIVSVPLLIGIDIDYGIFLVSVARRCRSRQQLRHDVTASVLAVLLCASATFLGFGSLAFTSVPAVRSLGWAVGIGVVTCAAASMFYLLPLLLWLRGRQKKSPV